MAELVGMNNLAVYQDMGRFKDLDQGCIRVIGVCHVLLTVVNARRSEVVVM
jgi:hypothetical protein